jgi:MFS transporter, PAT family, beta-lactamase induction signal transducer AmpG
MKNMIEANQPKKSRNPWSWIPSLYFAEGIPYVVVVTVAVIMYKRLGVSNTDIALYSSLLYWPWVIKPFWSPFVDLMKTKRWWIISMQLLIGAGLAGVAFTLPLPFFLQATLSILCLMAFSSATHDIAADGFYMLALDGSQQSFFVGIRSTFYRLAMITGQGLLIIIAGAIESHTGLKPVEFTVETSKSPISAILNPDTNLNISQKNEMCFVAFPSKLSLNTGNISNDSAAKIIRFAKQENLKNGFLIEEVSKKKKETWWTKNVSIPLGNFIRTKFGEQKTNKNEHHERAGNTGLISIRLSQKPDSDEKVILNSSLSKGDKNISLALGEQLVFTSKNWDKPAYVVVQLDYKLKEVVRSEFKGLSGNIRFAWSIVFFILAGLFLLLFVYHRFILPYPTSDQSSSVLGTKEIMKEFGLTFVGFFSKKGIGLAIAFLLFYRLGEAMLLKMVSPFLLDGREIGGLGLTTSQVGLVYGTVGILSLTLGGIVGGIAASRKGLKAMIWPMALSITLPHLTFLFLAWYLPESLFVINLGVAVEQFGYGFGFTAYSLYMIYFSDGKNKTAHYAMCTGLMAFGMMVPGLIAGWLQELLGYQHFFVFIMILAIPTLLLIPLMKIDPKFGIKKQKDSN